MTKVWIEADREDADLLARFLNENSGIACDEPAGLALRNVIGAIRSQIPEPPKWHFTKYANNTHGRVANLYLGEEFKGVLYGTEACRGAQALVDSLNAQAES